MSCAGGRAKKILGQAVDCGLLEKNACTTPFSTATSVTVSGTSMGADQATMPVTQVSGPTLIASQPYFPSHQAPFMMPVPHQPPSYFPAAVKLRWMASHMTHNTLMSVSKACSCPDTHNAPHSSHAFLSRCGCGIACQSRARGGQWPQQRLCSKHLCSKPDACLFLLSSGLQRSSCNPRRGSFKNGFGSGGCFGC